MGSIFDFRVPSLPWTPIDDAVMGGRSRSRFLVLDGVAIFEGTLSLANGGGFASVRSPAGPWDLSGATGIELDVRGDGRRYKLNLKPSAAFDGVQYQAAFETAAGRREVVRLPFTGFVPRLRGRLVPDAPPLDPARVAAFGLVVADGREGAFRLGIERVATYTIHGGPLED